MTRRIQESEASSGGRATQLVAWRVGGKGWPRLVTHWTDVMDHIAAASMVPSEVLMGFFCFRRRQRLAQVNFKQERHQRQRGKVGEEGMAVAAAAAATVAAANKKREFGGRSDQGCGAVDLFDQG